MTEVQQQEQERRALILYGSETGNSEDAAECLGRITERLHFVTRVCEMDGVQIVCRMLHFLMQPPLADPRF
jgi:sulfite reductase alpha subunit-like flavoprotein